MKRFYILIVLVLAVAISPAYSQFEGEIRFNLENYDSSNPERSEFTLTAANDRLFIQSKNDVNVMTGLKSNGLLVRNDLQDFVFNTGTDEALQVSKADLDGLMNMIERFSGASGNKDKESFDWKNRIIETDNRKEHLGYEVQEFRLLGENTNQYVSIWLTTGIKVYWGLMIDVWNRAGNRFADSELPVELIMNSNSFPLVVEVIDKGRVAYKFESVSVNVDSFDRSVVELPEQKRLLGLTEVMMNMFRQR